MLLQETPIKDLMNATKKNFKSDRSKEANSVHIKEKKFIKADDTLTCVAKISSASGNGTYTTKVEMNDMIYDEEGPLSLVDSTNQIIRLYPCTLTTNPIKTSCNCLDYYQRMASYNKSDQSLIGNEVPGSYKSPTTPENKKKGNPNNSIGLCKHLVALVNQLKKERVIVYYNNPVAVKPQ